MTTLEELWYGNIVPHMRNIKKGLQAEHALSLVRRLARLVVQDIFKAVSAHHDTALL